MLEAAKPGTVVYYERLIEEEQCYSQGRVDKWNKAIDQIRQLADDDEKGRLDTKLSIAMLALDKIITSKDRVIGTFALSVANSALIDIKAVRS